MLFIFLSSNTKDVETKDGKSNISVQQQDSEQVHTGVENSYTTYGVMAIVSLFASAFLLAIRKFQA